MPVASPRLPATWDDSVVAEVIVNREPFLDQLGTPGTAGSSPKRAELVHCYRQYTRLEEWEAVNKKLAREVVPVKRHAMADYAADAGGGAGVAALDHAPAPGSAAEAPAAVASPEPAVPNTRRSATAGAPSTQVAGRMCVGLAGPGEAGTPAASTHGAGQAGWAAAGGPRMALPVPQLQAFPPGRPDTAAPPASSAAAVAAAATAQRPSSEPEGISVRVQTVQANAVAGHSTRQLEPRHSSPRVMDKERAIYAHAKEMRSSRKRNTESKKRLSELLGSPSARIEATNRHPSRSFDVVPSQNVRVA